MVVCSFRKIVFAYPSGEFVVRLLWLRARGKDSVKMQALAGKAAAKAVKSSVKKELKANLPDLPKGGARLRSK